MSLLQPTLRAAEDGALGPVEGVWVVPQITKSNTSVLGRGVPELSLSNLAFKRLEYGWFPGNIRP